MHHDQIIAGRMISIFIIKILIYIKLLYSMFIYQANIIKRNVEINKNKGYNKNLNAIY